MVLKNLSDISVGDVRTLVDTKVYDRGREYFEVGAVTNHIVDDNELRASVASSSGGVPCKVMMEDRKSQITLEVVNGVGLSPSQVAEFGIKFKKTNGVYDLRVSIAERAKQLLDEAGVPISVRLAGTFAIDFAVKDVSKTTAVKYVLENQYVLSHIGLTSEDVSKPENLEVWGDKFSVINGGTDRHISEALPKSVRSIDFREEDPKEFLKGYNIVIWNGKRHLHEGLLEYLQSR